MKTTDFSTSFEVDADPALIFSTIQNVDGWWAGLYEEQFDGAWEKQGDEFIYRAGGGMHYSKQKLVELEPNKSLAWLVTESELSFLKDKQEWTNTKLRFELRPKGKKTRVTFTHEGLHPGVECYDMCAPVWTRYIQEKLLGAIAAG